MKNAFSPLCWLLAVPCWCSPPAAAAKRYHPKDYTQIIHDAREAEDNDYMIFSPAEDGKFTQYGYSATGG